MKTKRNNLITFSLNYNKQRSHTQTNNYIYKNGQKIETYLSIEKVLLSSTLFLVNLSRPNLYELNSRKLLLFPIRKIQVHNKKVSSWPFIDFSGYLRVAAPSPALVIFIYIGA